MFDLVPIILLSLLAFIVFGALFLYFKLRSIKRKYFGNTDILGMAKKGELELLENPKSLSGVESLVRPQILEDFPNFSLDELLANNKDEIFTYYTALKTGDFTHYEDKKNVNDKIAATHSFWVSKEIEVKSTDFHRQVVSSYRKNSDTATIRIQAAIMQRRVDSENKTPKKVQLRIETEWVNILDHSNFNMEGVTSASCPNCAAPLVGKDFINCPYCGSEIIKDFRTAWVLTSIGEK